MDKARIATASSDFGIALAFAIYLPHMESVAPMRRLAAEFNGIVEGSQHQVFEHLDVGRIDDRRIDGDRLELEAPSLIVEYVAERLLSRTLPADSLAALRQHFEAASGGRRERVRELLYAILTLPEYQLG